MTGDKATPSVDEEADESAEQDSDAASAENESSDDETATNTSGSSTAERGRQLSISVRSLVLTVVIIVLVAGYATLTWLYVGAQRRLDAQSRDSANAAHAEQIALEYATNAAAMNFKDMNGWKAKLVAGTTQKLKDRLSEAAGQMEQILVPLQWDSTARPLAAKVRSRNGGSYTVDAFVSVLTKTVQGPDPLQSTATYSVTVDSNQNWQITDVGGIDAAVKGQ